MPARVLVVGSINVDHLLRLERLPSPGETVVGEGELVRAPGGKGANAAAAAAALGAETTLVAAIGRDEDGDGALRDLEGAGVRCHEIQRVDAATGAAIVLTDAADENLIAVASGANRRLDPEHARLALERCEPGTVVLVNFEVPEAVVAAVVAQARRQGLALVVDPAPARPLEAKLISAAALLTPNLHEVRGLGVVSPERLLEAGAAAVAVTLGGEGCRLHRRGSAAVHIPAARVRVRDTVGAGDAFAAGASVGLAEGLDLEPAARLGCAAGALASTGEGARGASFDREAAQALINSSP